MDQLPLCQTSPSPRVVPHRGSLALFQRRGESEDPACSVAYLREPAGPLAEIAAGARNVLPRCYRMVHRTIVLNYLITCTTLGYCFFSSGAPPGGSFVHSRSNSRHQQSIRANKKNAISHHCLPFVKQPFFEGALNGPSIISS